MSSSSGCQLIRSLATSVLRSGGIEAGASVECVKLTSSCRQGILSKLDACTPLRAYSASSGSSSPSNTSTESLGESLFDIKDTKAFVEAATSNGYVRQRLASVLGSTYVGEERGAGKGEESNVKGDDGSTSDALTELFRYHNSSMLQQLSEGHMIKATVVKVDKRKAILDLRNGKFATIGVHELSPDSILERGPARDEVGLQEQGSDEATGTTHTNGSVPGDASGDDGEGRIPSDLLLPAPGDTVQVFLESIETPEGDVLVRGQESAVSRRTKAVWQELLERLKDGKPVKGRLLNSLAGGYSVGVAGIVCFLPNRNASKVTASRIGELSDYRVIQMNASRSNVVLSDCRLKRGEREGRGKRGGGRHRGGELLRY